jgi:hypothetical protein
MVRFTNGLLRQPLAVPRSTSLPSPGLPACPVARLRRPPRVCGRAQAPFDACSAGPVSSLPDQ